MKRELVVKIHALRRAKKTVLAIGAPSMNPDDYSDLEELLNKLEKHLEESALKAE